VIHDPRRGILLVVLFGFMILGMDTLAKHLTALVPITVLMWGRYTFHVAATPLLGMPGGMRGLVATSQPWLQVLRSLCMLLSTTFFFTAIKFIPLADAIAIGFVAPFIITGLSIPMLGEKVGVRRWAACAVGFAGALLIIRPGFEDRHWAYLLPLCAALSGSFYAILTRRLGPQERPTTSLFYTAAVGALVMSCIAPFDWVWPTPATWAMLVALGALAAVSHLVLIHAYRHAPASLLAPFGYLEIIWATLFGYLAFGDFPDALTWAGIAVIVASGLYVFHRETIRRKAPT